MKIGFIGLGNMATAMISGILQKEIVKSADILGSSNGQASIQKAVEQFQITPLEHNADVASKVDVLILSVKPQMYQTVIEEIRDSVKDDTIVISIAPGKSLAWLQEQFVSPLKLVRCMPNTPALVGAGCTGVTFGELVSKDDKERVMEILNSFGKAFEVSEHLMDTVVGVSGSSPAYVFVMLEAMADAAVLDGMPRSQAYQFAAQAVYGSAKLMLETGKHPGELKDMVCSPGGTTIAAVAKLEENGFRNALIQAQKACVDKSRQM